MNGQRPKSDQPPHLPKSGIWRSGLKFDGLSVSVRWEVDSQGQRSIRTVLIEAVDREGISARKVQQVKFGEIIDPDREIASRVIAGSSREPGQAGIRSAGIRFDLVLPSPKGWPAGHFERLAARYREVLKLAPTSPTQFLAKEYGVSKATMRNWLKHAHDNKLLPERTGKTGRPKGRKAT